MTNKRRLLSLLLCLWTLLPLFAVFAVPASAAVGADAMDASYVVDDLNTIGIDITKCKGDANDDRVEILNVTEFGYKANGDFSEYGLYLYLYNPSGKMISGEKNVVQLAYGLNTGGTSGYVKYRLKILSWSTGAGYENVLWKVKVVGAEAIAPLLNKAARTYHISGVEILRAGNSHATDYCYGGGSFTFTGYHKGCSSNDVSTLRCMAEKLDVVELELHPVSYYSEKTVDNSKRQVYDEVFGVYFSVPDWVIKRYGNLDDKKLKGLDSVKGCYREVTTNGILTNSDTLIALLGNPDINKDDIYFRCLNTVAGDGTRIYFRVTDNCTQYIPKSDLIAGTVPQFLFSNVFLKYDSIDGCNSEDFASLYRSVGKNALTRSAFKYYTVTKDDIGEAEKSVGFWKAVGNWFRGKESTGTVSFDMLQRITKTEAGALNVLAISEKFKVSVADAEALKSFAWASGDDPTYVMHFAVRECESDRITDAGTLDRDAWFDYFDEIDNIGDSYYFEKTVFEDFDILELTFRNKENKMSVVPVSASPIDVTGGIPSPGRTTRTKSPPRTRTAPVGGTCSTRLKHGLRSLP